MSRGVRPWKLCCPPEVIPVDVGVAEDDPKGDGWDPKGVEPVNGVELIPVDEPNGVVAVEVLLNGEAAPTPPCFALANGEGDGATVFEPNGDDDDVVTLTPLEENGDGEGALFAKVDV